MKRFLNLLATVLSVICFSVGIVYAITELFEGKDSVSFVVLHGPGIFFLGGQATLLLHGVASSVPDSPSRHQKDALSLLFCAWIGYAACVLLLIFKDYFERRTVGMSIAIIVPIVAMLLYLAKDQWAPILRTWRQAVMKP